MILKLGDSLQRATRSLKPSGLDESGCCSFVAGILDHARPPNLCFVPEIRRAALLRACDEFVGAGRETSPFKKSRVTLWVKFGAPSSR